MIDENKAGLIAFRLAQAEESLKEARILTQASLWRGAINRAYYAMFYVVLALAVIKQQPTSKHSGVLAFFDRDYVRTGIFPKELSRYLHFAFERRQNSDYGEVFTANQEEADQAIVEAEEFVEKVKDYLHSSADL
jgi:uncharacterized protein (UPF0332 family)